MVDPAFNPQNDCWICFYDSDDHETSDTDSDNTEGAAGGDFNALGGARYMPRSKHPASAMFLGAIASTGEVSPPIWFPSGFRLGADAYIDSLRKVLVPWMRRVAQAHGNVPYVFQQDSAPAHRARKTLKFLEEEGVKYWSPQ